MYDGVVQELIDELGRLPGVGPKSAQRIAFHLIDADPEVAHKLADVLREVKEKVRFCITCGKSARASSAPFAAMPSVIRESSVSLRIPKTSVQLSELGSFAASTTS